MKLTILIFLLTGGITYASKMPQNQFINENDLKQSIVEDLLKENSFPRKVNQEPIHHLIIQNHEKMIQEPDSIEPLLTLTRIYFILGQIKDAIHFSHRALELEPNNKSALFISAMLDIETENIEEAVQHLLQLKKQSEDERVVRLLAGVLAKQSQPHNAIRILEPYVTKHPSNVLARYELGIFYVQVGLKKEGIDFIQKASIHYPEDITILRNLSAAYFSDQQYQKAIDTLKRIIQIVPSRFSERRLLAEMLIIAEDFDLAKQEILILLELGDRSIDMMFLLSCSHAIEERWESSLELANKILTETESFTPAKLLKYFILKSMGREQDAEIYKVENNFSRIWQRILDQKAMEGSRFVSALLRETLLIKPN